MDQLLKYSDGSGDSFYSALTIDVEDGINISMHDYFGIDMKPTSRVVDNVDTILDICSTNNVKATFFILGEVAEAFPGLIKKIDYEGHEIGVHGYHHDQIFKLTPEKLRMELTRAKDMMENLTGQRVYGFRAPAFSINEKTSWALRIISECGFEYDSSIYPSVSGRYVWHGFSKQICRLELDSTTSIIEVPMSVLSFMGRDFPVCGGGYLRYFPYLLTQKAFRSINKQRPVIVYLHPYELDTKKYPELFYDARSKAQLKQKLPLLFYRFKKNTVKGKLSSLAREYRYIPLRQIISNLGTAGLIPGINLDQINPRPAGNFISNSD